MTPEEWLRTDEGHKWMDSFPYSPNRYGFFKLKYSGLSLNACAPYRWRPGVDIIPFTADGGYHLDLGCVGFD